MTAPRELSPADAASVDALVELQRASYERRGFAVGEQREVHGVGIVRYDRPPAL